MFIFEHTYNLNDEKYEGLTLRFDNNEFVVKLGRYNLRFVFREGEFRLMAGTKVLVEDMIEVDSFITHTQKQLVMLKYNLNDISGIKDVFDDIAQYYPNSEHVSQDKVAS